MILLSGMVPFQAGFAKFARLHLMGLPKRQPTRLSTEHSSLALLLERALLEQARFTVSHHLLLRVLAYQQPARVQL